MTVEDIIQRAGGVNVVAAATDRLGRDAVYKWKSIGIPDRHWPILIELCAIDGFDLTAQHLYEANLAARAERAAA